MTKFFTKNGNPQPDDKNKTCPTQKEVYPRQQEDVTGALFFKKYLNPKVYIILKDKMSILENILKPYKALFKGSKEQPKEVGINPEVETTEEKTVEEASSAKLKPVNPPKTIAPSNNRAGKVLWKKK